MLSSVSCEMVSETVVMSMPSGTTSYHSRMGRGGTGVGKMTPTCSRHPVIPSAMTAAPSNKAGAGNGSLRNFDIRGLDQLRPFFAIGLHRRQHRLGAAA